MIKMLKNVSIISCIALMMSCQSEDTDTIEEEALVEGEVELIDKAYELDLEYYKGVPVILEDNSVHSIEEVLTDAALFSEYEIAHRHHLQINLNEDTRTLYVSGQDKESAEKMMATINSENEITSSLRAMAGEWDVDYTLLLFDDDDGNGNEESIRFASTLSANSNFLANEFFENVSSARANKANSYETGNQPSGSDLVTTAYAYSREDGFGERVTLGGHNEVGNLENTSVGNDNVESVGFDIRISN